MHLSQYAYKQEQFISGHLIMIFLLIFMLNGLYHTRFNPKQLYELYFNFLVPSNGSVLLQFTAKMSKKLICKCMDYECQDAN